MRHFILLLCAICAAGIGCNRSHEPPPPRPPAAASSNSLGKASSFIGRTVTDSEGQPLGEVKDLALDVRTGRIAYAVVSTGGRLGAGAKLVAVPLATLERGSADGVLILRTRRDAWERAPALPSQEWPATASPWGGSPAAKTAAKQPAPNPVAPAPLPGAKQIHKTSDLVGSEVRNHNQERLGTVKDFVIDLGSGRVAYAILSLDTEGATSPKLVAVPTAALMRMPGRGVVLLNASKERLQAAPRLDATRLPEQPAWSSGAPAEGPPLPSTESGLGPALSGGAWGAHRDTSETGAQPSSTMDLADQNLADQLRRELMLDEELAVDAMNIAIHIDGSRVILKGLVRFADSRARLTERMRALVGAERVDDQLVVATPGPATSDPSEP